LDRAREYYEKALKLDQHNPYALYGMGNFYRWTRDYPRAIEFWERLLTKNEGTVNLLTRLGDAYRNVGRMDDAEKTYMGVLNRNYDKYAQLGLAKLRCLQGREEEALDAFDLFCTNEGTDPKIVNDMCDLLTQSGRREAAVRFYAAVLSKANLAAEEHRLLHDRMIKLQS